MSRCTRGHPVTPESTYVRPDGKRRCRECHREDKRLARRRHAAQPAAIREAADRERLRAWWLDRFTLDEIRMMAAAFAPLHGPAERLSPRQLDAMKRRAA